MRKKKPLNILVVVSVALLLYCAAGFGLISADESKPGKVDDTPVVGPRTDKLLRSMGDYLKTANQLSFHAEMTFDDMLLSGQKIQYSAYNDNAVQRPGSVSAEHQGNQGKMRI